MSLSEWMKMARAGCKPGMSCMREEMVKDIIVIVCRKLTRCRPECSTCLSEGLWERLHGADWLQ